MKRYLPMLLLATASFLSGVVFAIGLGLSGMTRPEKVIGFLDIAGDWDPTLAFVMGGAVLVSGLVFPWILRRRAPLLNARFELPTERTLTAELLVGSALFGVGWGLSGYCPGPALVSLVTGSGSVAIFVASMAIGLVLGRMRMTSSESRLQRSASTGNER